MTIRIIQAPVAIALWVLGAASVSAAEPGDLGVQLAAIEKSIEDSRKSLGVPGAAVVVIKDDRIVLNKGFGLRDVEKGLPVTPDTLFAIGSCTKAFTAMAAVMSADDGKLSLEDSPKRYLPYFKLLDREADAAVTLQDLLSHRTGLGRFDLAWITGVLNREEVIKVAGLAVPTARFREKFQYQNAMYSAAGEAIGAANGTTWNAVIAKRFFGPLGMTSSNTAIEEMQRVTNFSSGYSLEDGKASKVSSRILGDIAPAGAINSTTRDMAQWVRLMLNDGVFEGKRMISEKGFREILTPQIPMGGHFAYGLGWILSEWQGRKIAFHGGGIDGFNALVAFMPDDKLGFVILTNVSASSLLQIAEHAIWSNLVSTASAAPATPTSSPVKAPQAASESNVPKLETTVDDLMAKAIDAAGGASNLRKRHSVLMRWDLNLENQGLQGEMMTYAQAPNSLTTETTLLGLGKKIGTIRSRFDGTRGAEETSFSPAAILDDRQVEDLRVAADFYELLNWKTLYKEVKIVGKSEVEGEAVYVVRKVPEKTHPVTDYISTSTFQLLKRERLASLPKGLGVMPVSETYGDHREVDGVAVPFRMIVQHDISGRVVGHLKEIRHNVDPPAQTKERQ